MSITSRVFPQQDLDSWLAVGESLTVHSIQAVDNAVRELDLHHPATGSHTERVAESLAEFARFCGVSPLAAEGMQQAARLHDIGKLTVAVEYLASSKSELSQHEISRLRVHVPQGYAMIEAMPGLGEPLRALALDGIIHHHEHYSGGGYPRGLQGTQISAFGRVLKVADVFDAITFRGGYQPTRIPSATLIAMLDPANLAMAGQFDPMLLPLFAQMIGEGQKPRQTDAPTLTHAIARLKLAHAGQVDEYDRPYYLRSLAVIGSLPADATEAEKVTVLEHGAPGGRHATAIATLSETLGNGRRHATANQRFSR